MFKLSVLIALLNVSGSVSAKGHYGESITAKQSVALPDLINSPQKYAGKAVLTSGKVENVCEKKGCWMELTAHDASVRVTFKGYKYFVPVSLRNKKVRIQGEIVTKKESVEEQRHYLEDAGASKAQIAAIKEPKNSHEFVATGVEVISAN